MLKTSLFAAAMLAGSGLVVTTGAASANEMRAQSYCGGSGHDCPRGTNGDSGVNRYCPPGQVPHSFPNGNGIRCETLDGQWR